MPEQLAPPSRFPPRRGNAGDGGGGEIRVLSSSPVGFGFDDWRRDLGVLKERGRVRHNMKATWINYHSVLECVVLFSVPSLIALFIKKERTEQGAYCIHLLLLLRLLKLKMAQSDLIL
ncbi:hypothetical protein Droror1_Dr00011943 [Drosera rotundifolia]